MNDFLPILEQVSIGYAVAAVLALLIVLVAIRVTQSTLLRISLVFGFILFLVSYYFGLITLLSEPKPTSHEWLHRHKEKATVVASTMVEREGIYLWMIFPGEQIPRYYVLPWDLDLAKQLQSAKNEAMEKRGDGQVVMKQPFQQTLEDREKKFYPLPQMKMPAKQQQHPPMDYRGGSTTHTD